MLQMDSYYHCGDVVGLEGQQLPFIIIAEWMIKTLRGKWFSIPHYCQTVIYTLDIFVLWHWMLQLDSYYHCGDVVCLEGQQLPFIIIAEWMIKTSRGKWFSIPHYSSCEAINAVPPCIANEDQRSQAKKRKNAGAMHRLMASDHTFFFPFSHVGNW